jgi:hypothetical protein
MNELHNLIRESKKAVIRLVNYFEFNNLQITDIVDFDEVQETFVYLKGYADCLEKYDLIREEND